MHASVDEGQPASTVMSSKGGKEIPVTDEGFTMVWTDDLHERPMLISEFPEAEKGTFFDFYFNIDSSNWSPFSL